MQSDHHTHDWEENVVLQRMWSEAQVSHTSGILKKLKVEFYSSYSSY